MPKNSENLNRQLFDLLKSKGYDPTTLDTSGKETPVPEEAEVFQFDFTKNGEDYGKVTVSIDGLHKLIIYFGDSVANSAKANDSEEPDSEGNSWYALLRHLKKFAKNRQLSFELKNSNHLKHDMAKREYMKNKEKISEGYYPMGKKASYSDAIPNVKMVIQHTRQIEEGEQRYRNIARIFLENEQGERFLAPTTKPGIARVYARHIAEGGQPHDERWNHINSLCEEYQKMAGFVRAVRNGQFNESAQQLVNEGINHYQSLRETLSKMTGHRGYNTYFESYTPPLMEDDTDTSALNELFVQETLDPRIESVMPILSRLHKTVAEMKEVGALAEWADSLIEDGCEASEEPTEPMTIDENSGLQALNPQGIPESIADDYEHMSDRELMRHAGMLGLEKNCVPDDEGGLANRREIIYLLQKEAEGDLEESGLQAYLGNKKYGKEGMDALRKAGREHAGKETMAKIRAKYDKLDEEDMEEGILDTVKKVGGKVLDKLGHGSDEELIRDLQKKAGVPQHGQKGMAHDKDEDQLEEDGQFAGDYKTGPEGQWRNKGPKANKPAQVGDLVGANESVEQGVAEGTYSKDVERAFPDGKASGVKTGASAPKGTSTMPKDKEKAKGKPAGAITEMDKSDDVKGPEGKATPIKADKAKKDFAKMFQKNIDKANKDKKDTDEKVKQHQEVKEGQEDLDAILRIIRK